VDHLGEGPSPYIGYNIVNLIHQRFIQNYNSFIVTAAIDTIDRVNKDRISLSCDFSFLLFFYC